MRPHNLSRRSFLKTTLGTAGVGLGMSWLPGCTASPMHQLKEIGLQVYTIRDVMDKDWKTALTQVAQIGYKNIEMGNFLGPSLESFMDFLKQIGLKTLSGGGNLSDLEKSLPEIIDSSLKMGKKYVVSFWPWSDSPENKKLDDWKRVAESLNKIGEQVKKAGLVFAYHNHAIEFAVTEGRIPYDILLENTDPALVGMEIDLYWIEKGGCKSIPYFEKFPGRFPLWHVKDMDNTEQRSFACVGQGIIDFPAIFAKAELAGLQYVFVEQDQPVDAIECARVSCEYLKKLRF
jgi:sugar phosphate isomerase/epimerase